MSVPLARLSALLVALCAVTAVMPAAASAGQFKKDSAIDAKTVGLSGKQRKAIDIIGVDVTKTQYMAKIIVRFKGNFERQLRSRKLKKAGALIQLTMDGTKKRTTIASVGSGKRLKTIGGLGPGGPFAAVRDGREVTFYVAGINAYKLKAVDARSFQGAKRHKGKARSAVNELQELRGLLRRAESDVVHASITGTELKLGVDCGRLSDLVNQLNDELDGLSHGLGKAKGPEQAEAQAELAELRDLVDQGRAFLALPPCTKPAGTGGGSGGGSGTPAPPASATSCPLVATAESKPNPPAPNPLDTNVHGQCNGAWDYYDIELDASHAIEGWIVHSNKACEVYDQNGTKLTQNPDGSVVLPPGSHIAKLRCFNKGDNLIDIDLDISPDPTGTTQITVTVYRNSAALFPATTLTR